MGRERLTEAQYDAIEKAYLEGVKSSQEIGREVGLTKRQVDSALYYLKHTLRRIPLEFKKDRSKVGRKVWSDLTPQERIRKVKKMQTGRRNPFMLSQAAQKAWETKRRNQQQKH